jgi:hypothetical protein
LRREEPARDSRVHGGVEGHGCSCRQNTASQEPGESYVPHCLVELYRPHFGRSNKGALATSGVRQPSTREDCHVSAGTVGSYRSGLITRAPGREVRVPRRPPRAIGRPATGIAWQQHVERAYPSGRACAILMSYWWEGLSPVGCTLALTASFLSSEIRTRAIKNPMNRIPAPLT